MNECNPRTNAFYRARHTGDASDTSRMGCETSDFSEAQLQYKVLVLNTTLVQYRNSQHRLFPIDYMCLSYAVLYFSWWSMFRNKYSKLRPGGWKYMCGALPYR